MMSSKAKFCVLLSILLWSSAFVGIREGLTSYSPEGLALLRFLIASSCMGIIYFFLPERSPVKIKEIILMLAWGTIGIGVYNICLNHGELVISSGMSSFIISQSPLITAVLAAVFLGDRMNKLCLLGFFVSAMGILFIALGELGELSWNINLIYIFIATLASALYLISQKPFVDKYHALEVTAFYIWGGTLFLLIYLPNLQHDIQSASMNATLMVFYLGIFPGAIALMAWGYALKEISAARAGSFLYFMPFLATLLGWFFLHEVPVLLSILGGLLAIAGVWLVNHSYKIASPANVK